MSSSASITGTSDAAQSTSPPARRSTKRLAAAIVCGLLALLLVVRVVLSRPAAPPPLIDLPAYALTDQNGKPFGSAELSGKVYVADFVFTSCPSICPRLTQRMRDIEQRTADLGDGFRLITFSVDPETDTPERLSAYARQYQANTARWTFLTGPLGQVETIVVNGFKTAMGRTDTGTGILDIFHGERLVLVDRDGKIRKFYDADDEGIAALVRDARLLVSGR